MVVRMRAGAAAIALVMLAATAARAEDDRETVEARQAFKEGVRLYDVHEYKDALAAFKRAYVKYESPLLFYNIAQCQRQLGNKTEAVQFYKMYLAALPNSPDRERVELIIQDLQHPPAAAHVDEPAPIPAPAPVPEESPEVTPVYKRWWLWTLVAAVVVVGAGVAIGVAVAGSSGPTPPDALRYTVRF
jgi:tetratricopeptide (TPR) repeat protein